MSLALGLLLWMLYFPTEVPLTNGQRVLVITHDHVISAPTATLLRIVVPLAVLTLAAAAVMLWLRPRRHSSTQ